MTGNTLYHVEVNWANGAPPTRILVGIDDLGYYDTFDEWRSALIAKGSTRPCWVQLGELAFHTQGVRSIELIETIEIEKED